MRGIVYYENPPPGQEGHYGWMWSDDTRIKNWLDITLSPLDQTNTINLNSVGQFNLGGTDYSNVTDDGAMVAVEDQSRNTLVLQFGDDIVARRFDDLGIHAAENDDTGGVRSNFEIGAPAYIGVLTGSGNYGWILVVRGGGDLEEQMSLTAIAWAYETIPGKPLYAGQVPAPGALAAFALAAPPFLTPRRRRKESTDERTSGPYSERTR